MSEKHLVPVQLRAPAQKYRTLKRKIVDEARTNYNPPTASFQLSVASHRRCLNFCGCSTTVSTWRCQRHDGGSTPLTRSSKTKPSVKRKNLSLRPLQEFTPPPRIGCGGLTFNLGYDKLTKYPKWGIHLCYHLKNGFCWYR